MRTSTLFFAMFFLVTSLWAQTTTSFGIALEPVSLPGMPGLHSFAHAQHNGDWLIVGGRLDGIHPRQPFASFPSSYNNTNIYVVRPATGQSWSVALSSLPIGLAEQLQSTNQNYTQVGDTLFVMGGYGYAPSANDHITHSHLIAIQVSSLIQAVINNQPIQPHFKSTSDTLFHVTGGQLAFLDGYYYLVGGQVFTGRYNPMGHATYTQRYLTRIVKFTIDNRGATPQFSIVQVWNDSLHLRRRDYNLLLHQSANGQKGLLVSSGVFQPVTDLPFLYPVEIYPSGYTPRTEFSQLLSHYHSAKVSLLDTIQNQLSHVFFGGMAQFYYLNGTLMQDNNVPFVKTISRVVRMANDSLVEEVLPMEMPGYLGAGAEFFSATDGQELQYFSTLGPDTATLGYIFGGIHSTATNPFSTNQIALTQADAQCWKVKAFPLGMGNGGWMYPNNSPLKVFPNPGQGSFHIWMPSVSDGKLDYQVFDLTGRLVTAGTWMQQGQGGLQQTLEMPKQAGVFLLVVRQHSVVLSKATLQVVL